MNKNILKSNLSYDIFCDVIDNLGDIGVCWRLSRALVHYQNAEVRLWCNNLIVAKQILSEIVVDAAIQDVQGVELRKWSEDGLKVPFRKSEILIEAFACDVPELWWEIGNGKDPLVHINLEYLGLEKWTLDVHEMLSIGGRVPKYIYIPGPNQMLGGLTSSEAHNKILDKKELRLKWLGSSDVVFEEKWLFLFSYPRNHQGLLNELESSDIEWIVWLSADQNELMYTKYYKNITFVRLPFLDQSDFDCLLQVCDLLWVRGEESLSRALLSGVPFLWEAYRQELNVRLKKVKSLHDFISQFEPTEIWKNLQIELNSKVDWADENHISSLLNPESQKCFKKCANLLEKNELSENLTKFCLSKIKP